MTHRCVPRPDSGPRVVAARDSRRSPVTIASDIPKPWLLPATGESATSLTCTDESGLALTVGIPPHRPRRPNRRGRPPTGSLDRRSPSSALRPPELGFERREQCGPDPVIVADRVADTDQDDGLVLGSDRDRCRHRRITVTSRKCAEREIHRVIVADLTFAQRGERSVVHAHIGGYDIAQVQPDDRKICTRSVAPGTRRQSFRRPSAGSGDRAARVGPRSRRSPFPNRPLPELQGDRVAVLGRSDQKRLIDRIHRLGRADDDAAEGIAAGSPRPPAVAASCKRESWPELSVSRERTSQVRAAVERGVQGRRVRHLEFAAVVGEFAGRKVVSVARADLPPINSVLISMVDGEQVVRTRSGKSKAATNSTVASASSNACRSRRLSSARLAEASSPR